MKLLQNCASGKRDVVSNHFLFFSSGGNLVEWSETFLHNVGRSHNKKHVYEFILNLDQWFRGGGTFKENLYGQWYMRGFYSR